MLLPEPPSTCFRALSMRRECFSLVALVQSLRMLQSLEQPVLSFLRFAEEQVERQKLLLRLRLSKKLLNLLELLLKTLVAFKGSECKKRQKELLAKLRSRLLGYNHRLMLVAFKGST
jgi:hypothetical protein